MTRKNNTLLITGASGFLGRIACRHFSTDWQIHGVTFQQSLPASHVQYHCVDLTSHHQLQALFDTIQPSAVLHLAALSKPDSCEEQPEQSQRINVDTPTHLAKLCAEADAHLVFTSTDLVFAGNQAPYAETDTPNPINRYGQQKVAAEKAIVQIHPSATICRMPLLFGRNSGSGKTFLDQLIINLQQQQSMSLFDDEYRSMVSGAAAMQGLEIGLNHAGELLHLGGTESISRYEFGLEVAQVTGLSSDCLTPISSAKITTKAARAKNVSLISKRAQQLGYEPGSIQQQLQTY